MKEFDNLVKIVTVLRSKCGCPWDRAQRLDSYKKYLLEETYELIDGLAKKKLAIVREELGDIFLILVAISHILNKKNKFNLRDVFDTITKKLIKRHPHVFGLKKLNTKEEVYKYWVRHKAKSKRRKTLLERLPKTAPSLLLAEIFIKEFNILNREKMPQDLVLKLKQKIETLKNVKKGSVFYEILFDLCKLAYINNVDLELGLRDFIIKKASKVHY
ncbi:MAG: nucleoside triphosphate pyrophosphohydrolase [Candidatus Omnitrophica bacterium]|nr:nucleoside triphosphate pyrophosphohydrolase [Candidatus Omnitrophota bacterium]